MAKAAPLAAIAAALDQTQRIVLTPALVPAGAVQTFIEALPDKQLALTGAALASGAGGTTLTGRCAGPWGLPYVAGFSLSDIDVSIAFTAGAKSDPPVDAITIVGATMASPQGTVLLAGAVTPDGALDLHVSPLNHNTPTVALSDVVAVITSSRVALAAVEDVPLFKALPISAVDLSFGFAPTAPASITLTSQLGSAWAIIDSGLFTLSQPAITLAATFRAPTGKDAAPTRFSAMLTAKTSIGSAQFGVSLSLVGADPLTLDVVPAAGQTIPALLDLAGAVGGDALRSAVQAGVQTLGLGGIAVDSLSAAFSPSTRHLTAVTLDGHLTLGGGSVDLIVQFLPDFTFSGRLPAAAKGAAPTPSGISLNALATQIFGDAADLPHLMIDQLALFAYPHIGSFTLSVSTTEDWSWDISGHGSGPALVLQQVGLDFQKSPQAVTGTLAVSAALGGFDVALSAAYQGRGASWLLSGSGSNSSGVAVTDLLQDLAHKLNASIPSALANGVQSLRVVSLAATIDTHGKAFTFTGDVDATGRVPLGLETYDVDLRVSLSSTVDPAGGQRSFAGHLEADLDIGDVTFALTFDFGATKVVTGSWRSTDGRTLDFLDVARAIGITDPVVVPGGLDLGLKSASFTYDVAAKSFTFSAESSLFGDAFMTTATGSDGRWGFVFGVDSPNATHLSSLPVVGGDLKPADFLTFEQAAILIASNAFKTFSVPPLPPLPPTKTQAGRAIAPLASGATLQLAEGLSVAAELDLTTGSSDRRLANLRSIVGQSSLILQAVVGPAGVSLFAELAGKIGIPAGSGKLILTQPTVRIDFAPLPAFQLSGGLGFTIESTPVTATARLIISETEAQAAVALAADQGALPAPPGVRGLHLEQFGVEMGVFFEPPGVDLGLQGQCRIGEEQALQADQFAFVLEVVEEVPNLLYLSFYVDRMDLGQVVTLFTDRQEPATVQALEIVKASDLSFHWSESQVVLPDGTVAAPGFGFSASLQIFAFAAHAELQVGVQQGVFGRAEMSPINLQGILHVQGDGKGMMRTFQQSGGQWTEVTNDSVVRQIPPLPTRRDVVVPAGGPVIEFNAMRSPFVHVDWNVTLFDLVRSVVDVTISDTGFSFALTYQLASIAKFDMTCVLKDANNFSAAADLAIHVDASIGPIHFLGVNVGSLRLNVDVGAALAIILDPSLFSLSLAGHFCFEGLSMTVPTVTVTAAPASLSELPPYLLAQIKQAADQIFHDLFSDASKWADMIGRGVVTGVTDMASTLKTAYKVSAQDAVKLMCTAKQSAETVAAGLKTAFGQSADAVATSMRGAGFAANEVASGLKTGFGLTAQSLATTLKRAGFAASEVGAALHEAFGETAQEAALVLKGAGFAANETADAMKTAFGQSTQQVAAALRGAGFAADQVSNALRTGFGQSAQQVAGLLRGAGYDADDVGGALKNDFRLGANGTAQLLRGAGYGVDSIGDSLRRDFGATPKDAAVALKSAGFAANEAGAYIKKSFSLGPDALKDALQGAGFPADEVKGFFKSLGGDFSHAFKDAGSTLEHGGESVIHGLKHL